MPDCTQLKAAVEKVIVINNGFTNKQFEKGGPVDA